MALSAIEKTGSDPPPDDESSARKVAKEDLAHEQLLAEKRAEVYLPAVSVYAIRPCPFQNRTGFDAVKLRELAESIRENGLLQPLVVRPKGDGYELVMGERRWRALKLAERETAPAIVRHGMTDLQVVAAMNVENDQREDLNPMERARGLQTWLGLGASQKQIAGELGRDASHVSNLVRLLKLPEDVQGLIETGELTLSHGKALLRFEEFPAYISAAAALAVKKGTPSKDLEKGIPFLWEIPDSILRRFQDYSPPPFIEVCKTDCPFAAYRREGQYNACLNPEHYAELMAQADAERVKRAREEREANWETILAQMRERHPDVAPEIVETVMDTAPSVREMPSGTYVILYPGQEPEGCTGECPCRSDALGYNGEIVSLCTDPERVKGLLTAQEERAKAEREARITSTLAEVHARLDAGEVGSRELAPMTRSLFRHREPGPVVRALETAGLGNKAEGHLLTHHGQDLAAWEWMAGLELADLARLVMTYAVSEEAENARRYGKGEMPLAEWYLGRRKPEAADAPEPAIKDSWTDEDEGDMACGDCDRVLQPGETFVETEEDYLCPPCATKAGIRFCRKCGCTDEFGCDGGCSWIEDDLCSSCEGTGDALREAADAAGLSPAFAGGG